MALSLVAAMATKASAIELWDHWDVRWYAGIAQHGYLWGIGGKPALAFFPLYPLLIRAAMMTGLSPTVSAMVVSNAAFVAATYYLYRLVADELGTDVAGRAVWFLCLFPTAFFTFAGYSESLFLLAAIASLFYARRYNLLATAVWLAVAVLARPTGALVVPAALVALCLHARGGINPVRLLVVLAPTALGITGYLVYLHFEGVSLPLLLSAQQFWHRSLTAPWVGFTSSIAWLIQHGASSIPWAIENLLEGAVTVVCLVLTARAWKDLRWDARAYCLGFWSLVLLTPEWRDGYHAPFSSVDRYVLALFPVLAWAAWRTPERLARRLGVASAVTMLALVCDYLAGGWIG